MRKPTGHPWLARYLDLAMSPLQSVRARLIPLARGRVLEIGGGTGANLEWYRDVESITVVEPDPHMRVRAERRALQQGVAVELLEADAASLPFPDESFDTVVATFVLCTIPEVETAIREMRRVLKPGGCVLYAEHTRSEGRVVHATQRALTPLWMRVAGGCRMDRDSLGMLREAGFELEPISRPRGPNHPFPVHYGVARPRS